MAQAHENAIHYLQMWRYDEQRLLVNSSAGEALSLSFQTFFCTFLHTENEEIVLRPFLLLAQSGCQEPAPVPDSIFSYGRSLAVFRHVAM